MLFFWERWILLPSIFVHNEVGSVWKNIFNWGGDGNGKRKEMRKKEIWNLSYLNQEGRFKWKVIWKSLDLREQFILFWNLIYRERWKDIIFKRDIWLKKVKHIS